MESHEYDYNNETPQAAITQFVSYHTSVNTSHTVGPRLYAHDRTTIEGDATWSGLSLLAVTAADTRNSGGYDHRIFKSTAEDVFRLTADAVGHSG